MKTGRILLAAAALATNAFLAYARSLPDALGDPIERPSLISGGISGIGRFSGFTLVGNTMYVAAGALAIYDVTNPAKLRQIGAYATGAEAFSVHVSGSIAQVQTTGGVISLDISNPAAPKQV